MSVKKCPPLPSYTIVLQLISGVAKMRFKLIVLLGLPIITIGFSLITPYILKTIVNTLSNIQATPPFFVSLLLIGYGVSWIISQLLSQLRMLIAYHIIEHGKQCITLKTIDHLLYLSPRFHTERKTGALTSYLDKAQHGFETMFWSLIVFLLPTTIELLATIIIISWLFGPVYGVILFWMMAGYLFFGFRTTTTIKKAQKIVNEKSAQSTAKLVDSLLNYETTRYFNNQRYEYHQIRALLADQEQAALTFFTLDIRTQMSQLLIIGIGLSSITWFAGNAVYYGTISLGNFVLINGYLMQFILPLNYLSNALYQARKGLQDVKSVIELLQTESEIQYTCAVHVSTPQSLAISFNNVSFGYVPDRPILKNISFSVSPGTSTALVGPSGSGKSTIAKLMFRFYDV